MRRCALPSESSMESLRAIAWNRAARRHFGVDAALALLLLVLFEILLFTGGVGAPEPGDRDGDALGVALVALATLPLAFRRHWPVTVFLVSAGAAGLANLLEYPGEILVVPAVGVYTLAGLDESAIPRSRAALLSGSVFVGIVVSSALVGERGSGYISLAVFWVAAWIAGAQSRLRRVRMEELEDRARRAEREAERERRLAAAEERGRIARELHDSAGHAINAILLQLQAARVLRDRDPDRAEAALDTVERVARETIAEIDRLVGALRDDEPAEVAPPAGVEEIEALVERHRGDGLHVTMTVRGVPRPCSPGVDRAAFRIAQEALTNASRYGSGPVELVLDFEEAALELAVVNPIGGGGATRRGGGHGIPGMRERAHLLGGSLEAAHDGTLFRVRAQLPYEAASG
jgi:signal transduction histidine kinase